MKKNNAVKVVCLGNPFRGDDGAGHRVAELLKDLPEVIYANTPTDLLNIVTEETRLLIIVDAVIQISQPGKIHKVTSSKISVEEIASRSTHAIPLKKILELLSALDQFRGEIVIYGIEGRDFGKGQPISDEVQRACQTVAAEIRQILAEERRGRDLNPRGQRPLV